MSEQPDDRVPQPATDVATGLDMLLSDGALGPVRRLLPAAAGPRMAASLATRPGAVLRRGADLATEAPRIGIGSSDLAPHPRGQALRPPGLVGQRPAAPGRAAAPGRERHRGRPRLRRRARPGGPRAGAPRGRQRRRRPRPSNSVLNPLAWAEARKTRGASVVRGVRRLLGDLAAPPRVPSMVEPDAFTVGEDLAAAPGAVVLRTPVFGLIQYLPSTASVREVPLLVVPPTINEYYVTDLAPGRSIVEHRVAGGQQVFLISWRKPTAEHADWGLDTYGRAILDGMDACERITGTDRTSLMAFCSGGTITAMLLGHLAAIGAQERVASVTFAVAVLDQDRAGTPGALLDETTARAAVAASAQKGHLDGRTLAEVFAWLRPTDLTWSYWGNNYLRGRSPRPFDILYRNADTTRMTARLHRDFVDRALSNALVRPGAAAMLGTTLDLSAVDRDAYVIAGIADHLCAWQSCYPTTQLIGGRSRFVLSTSGHIASMVNPPGNPKASWRVSDATPADPQRWLEAAHTEQGSWWPDHVGWLGERSGATREAPAEPGGRGLPALAPAPGEYVRAQ